MSYKKIKSDSYCVGGRHHSSTGSIESDITETVRKMVFGKDVQCNGIKSMTVGDNTKQTEGLGKLFKTGEKLLIKQVKSL